MRHFGFDRTFGTSLSALTVGLALTWGAGAGAQSVVTVSQTPEVAQSSDVTPAFVDAVRQALVQNPEIILEVLTVLEAEQAAEKAGEDRSLIARHADDLFAGLDPTKPILIEFQDYNCGYCRRVHPDVTAVRDAMPDLQVVVMEFPILGEESRYAAEMALAVKAVHGATVYHQFVDSLMLADSSANPATVLRILDILGLDGAALTQSAKSREIAKELERAAYLARTMGIRGTPAFIGPSGISRGAVSRAQLAALTAPLSSNADTSSKGE